MKIFLYLTLLGAALLGNVFVFGQGAKPGHELGQTLIESSIYIRDSVRIMTPDRMPCRIVGLSRVEPMPVQRSRNLEPMPNMMIRKPVIITLTVPKQPQ